VTPGGGARRRRRPRPCGVATTTESWQGACVRALVVLLLARC
jgi:hypothetical protein